MSEGPTPAPDPAALHPTASADDLLVVDCLLPGQVRKLGGRVTYLTPRRPIKTTAIDCEIRGGEYTAYDRANYSTALAVWLPAAERGDPEAQNSVGEIYERGLGRAPDFAVAAQWYRRAAEQESPPAQINLGQLYERGLGVERDIAQALRWYDRAAGIEGGSWELVSGPELAALREELAASSAEADGLRRELGSVRRELGSARQQRAEREAAAAAARNALVDERLALAEERRRLALESERVEAASAVLARRRAESAAHDDDAAQAAARAALLETREAELQAQFEALSASSAELERVLHELRSAADRAQLDRDRASEREAIRAELAVRESELEAQRAALEERATSLERAQREVARERGELEAIALARSALEQYGAELALRENALQERNRQMEERARELSLAEASMQEKSDEIAAMSDEIARLRGEAEAQRQRLADLANQQPVAVAGPSIQMIDPLIVATRDRSGLREIEMAPGVMERVVVGRVVAPAGLLSLTVNDLATPITANGVFERMVPIGPDGTEVDIVAIDRLGERVDMRFVLFSEQATALSTTPAVGARPPLPRDIDFGRFFALVIGNDDYRSLPDLETAGADADAVSEILAERYGFEVTTLHDATRYEILSALSRLTSTLTRRDNLLVYYAGHGELDRVNQVGHWLPVDAERDNPANWLSTRSLTDLLNRMKAQHVLVIADSCYSGALTRSAVTQLRTGQQGSERLSWLRAQRELRVRMALTSGGLEPVLDIGGGGHSFFAQSLIDVLQSNTGVLDGMSLYQAIAARVYEAAREHDFEQIPEYAPIRHAQHENGHFLFVPRV